jgi:hypothetical protein
VTGEEVLIACFAVSGFIGHRTPLPSVDERQPVNFTSVMACLKPAPLYWSVPE